MRQQLKHFIQSLLGVALFASNVQASNVSAMSVLPYAVTNMSDVAIDSQMRITRSNNSISYLDIYVNCFGANLRAVANPISPVSQITAYINFKRSGGDYKSYQVTFPAKAAVSNESVNQDLTPSSVVVDTSTNTVIENFTARLAGNLIRVQMKNASSQSVDVLAGGVLVGQLTAPNVKSSFVNSIRFEQTMPPGAPAGQYMGADGPLSSNLRWYFSENGKYTTVYASFPGEEGYCGGFHSPLMLSFDEDVPVIDSTSPFRLNPKVIDSKDLKFKYSWPAFKKKIYFLAVDNNKNGKIDGGEELFGDVNGYSNGFENLATFDENKDQVINSEDKIFEKLLLWRDKNGDGVCQKSELAPLSKFSVASISLKHKNDIRYVGDRGKILGPAVFEYKSKNGEMKQGNVWDVFLKLVP